jgi:non-specific serine/threonine protein kinase
MRLLAESGRRGEALRVYQTLATTLEQELEVAPSAEVAALRARLVTQEVAPHAAARPPTPVRPARPTNLPLAQTSFVGRHWEIRAVTEALATARLVTLTGPGGCGKTRLALAVAERLGETATDTDAYPDGVWLVELAALADPALVPQTVAATLGVAEQAGQPLCETLAAFLQPRRTLLVLDNCEHLLAACAALVAHLLQGCPHLRILATSREGLAVAGEQIYLVPSLAAPDPAHLPPLERLGAYEAVTLFLERARARRPELALSAATAAVAQICARLDGLPLALELAAARVGMLPVETIAARLDDRFRLLTGGPRTALPRQQTLQATLDWSYALLGASERRVLNRLAVFAGGWTLQAAEEVCSGDAGATETVLDVLTGLVHKSLVHVVQAQTTDRYRLLETVQQYALAGLVASGEAEEVHRRQSRYYLALAAAEPHDAGSEQLAWLERLEQEHDNLRAALRWALDMGDSDGFLLGAITLAPFWRKRGYLTEGRTWLEAGLAASVTSGPSVRALTLLALGRIAEGQGDGHRATEALSASRDLFRALGDQRGLAAALLALGNHLGNAPDPPAAYPLLAESMALCREVGDRRGLLRALRSLANNDSCAGDDERATRLLTESATLARELGQAEELAVTLSDQGIHSLRQRRYHEAESFFQAALPLLVDLGDTFRVLDCLEFLAAALGCQQAGECAATLFAAVAAARTQMGAPLPPSVRVLRDHCYEAARARTDAVTWTTAWEQGVSLPLERAVREAVGVVR